MVKFSTSLCLVSAVIEFVFFLIALTVLWLGFSMRIMLVTHWGFCCSSVALTLRQGLFIFPCSASQQLHKKLGESAQPGQLTPTGKFWAMLYTIPWKSYPKYNPGWIREGQSLLGDGFGRRFVLSSCIVHYLSLLGFYSFILLSLGFYFSLSHPLLSIVIVAVIGFIRIFIIIAAIICYRLSSF